jgi:hypothetical protein
MACSCWLSSLSLEAHVRAYGVGDTRREKPCNKTTMLPNRAIRVRGRCACQAGPSVKGNGARMHAQQSAPQLPALRWRQAARIPMPQSRMAGLPPGGFYIGLTSVHVASS